MKILAVYRHYWPDTTPYARLLKSILERLAEQGHEVTVLTGQPCYNGESHAQQPWQETLGGVRVQRVRLPVDAKRHPLRRALGFALFLLRAVIHAVRHRRYDLVIANSHPPVAIGLALRLIKALTGSPYLLHLQDLHPEASSIIGRVRRPWLYRLLRRIEAANCRAALRLVTLSEDMRRTIAERGVETSHVRIVNNSPLKTDDSSPAQPPELLQRLIGPKLLFAGNLGRYQALSELLSAFQSIPDSMNAKLVFMGSGAMLEALREQSGGDIDERIFFVPQQPVEVAKAALLACDLSLVSLSTGMTGVAYPSKVAMTVASGTPMVALVDSGSTLAETIRNHQLGVVAEDNSKQSITAAMVEAIHTFCPLGERERRRIAEVGEREFGEPRMLDAWEQLIAEIASPTQQLPAERLAA